MSTTIAELAEIAAVGSDAIDSALEGMALALHAIRNGEIADAVELLENEIDTQLTAYRAIEPENSPAVEPWNVPLAPMGPEDLTR
jgi:hypothetical protein